MVLDHGKSLILVGGQGSLLVTGDPSSCRQEPSDWSLYVVLSLNTTEKKLTFSGGNARHMILA